MSELFNGFVEPTDLCHDVNCCIKQAERKQSENPNFYFVRPQFPSTAGGCERKIINKFGNLTTCFFNKNKDLILECILTGNYGPLIAIIPKHCTFSLFTDEGVLLFTNSIPTPLMGQVLLALNSFYSINLFDFKQSNNDPKSNRYSGKEITFCFKILAKYNVSIPSALSQILLSNIVGLFTIEDPVL